MLPVFAFANAGVSFSGISFATLAPVPLGIALGLVAGKLVGVLGASFVLIKAGFARLPAGATWIELAGVAMLCGIGLTMSLFIGSLAFERQGGEYDALLRLGVLCGLVSCRIDEPIEGIQHSGMPTVFPSLRGYRLFFFSVDRGEPMHIHVTKGRAYAKYWMHPLTLARSRNFRSHELNEVARLVEEHREEIERKWHEHFGREN